MSKAQMGKKVFLMDWKRKLKGTDNLTQRKRKEFFTDLS